MKRYIFRLLATALFASCIEPIEFDPGETSPYVVLISRPTNDSTVCVHLARSRFFLENSVPQAISDAQVTLSLNGVATAGVFDDDAYNGFGAYTFAVLPQPGDSLRVEAQVPGFDERVTASTYIPQQPEVEVLELVVDTGSNSSYYDYSYGDYYYKIRFKVHSNGNNDFFAVRILTPELILGDTSAYWDTLHYYCENFQVNDPIVNRSDFEDIIDGYDGSFNGFTMYFSSELFTGGSHEFSAIFHRWASSYTDYATMPIVVEVQALSKELYRYIQTTDGYYSEIDELFGEPVHVICNIQNGIGVFGGYTTKRFAAPPARYGHFDHGDGYYYKAAPKNNHKSSRKR